MPRTDLCDILVEFDGEVEITVSPSFSSRGGGRDAD